MLSVPRADELAELLRVLRTWQREGGPVQLHPGDVGWFWRFGADATAAAVRTWSRDGVVLAVGLRDGDRLLRLAVAPGAEDDDELARQVADDVAHAERGVLPAGAVDVEARSGGALVERLREAGWTDGEAWTPLVRGLTEPVEPAGVDVETVGADGAPLWAAVQGAAFGRPTPAVERWHAMAAGPAFADARCLLARDADGTAVAVAVVWSAGAGRPGVLEPMGVHPDHRGHGYGTAITVAAAAHLRALGASSAAVCTPSANGAGVATYRAAGFRELPAVRDVHRAVPGLAG
ncbi:GNAT family N-acetyltransferase [Actinotalea ferrariae]|uniref:GNAT family N-acetyltransferase n=1 Tax=Actinotalea ferrariae TaxID=1386098 RepID=UPI0027E1DD61|nr:GNAT family N-acetyltransferase [Actinotalea ferrariae]